VQQRNIRKQFCAILKINIIIFSNTVCANHHKIGSVKVALKKLKYLLDELEQHTKTGTAT
jgi:hypothetical protein